MKTYEDIKRDLNITDATIRNWVKTGVLPSCPNAGFSDNEYQEILANIKGKHKKLQQGTNRREKHTRTYSSLASLTVKARLIISDLRKMCNSGIYDYNQIIFIVSIIILQSRLLISCSIESGRLAIKSQSFVFTKFLNDWMNSCNVDCSVLYNKLIILDYPDEKDDFLGLVYESLRTVSEKSINGAFFTPAEITKDIKIECDSRVLDPCSGTGTILLNTLDKNHNPSKIVLRDIDSLALKIAKVNFVLFFNSPEKLVKTEILDITNLKSSKGKFDVIISNPPFGAKFSNDKKEQIQKDFAFLKSTESFSVAMSQSLRMLNPKGRLCFVMPESVLFVSSHEGIRKSIFGKDHSVKLHYFGNAFRGVMSNIVRIDLQKYGNQRLSFVQNNITDFFSLDISANQYRPPFVKTQDELDLYRGILSVSSFNLTGRIKTGIGIVTGNNSRHLVKHNDTGSTKSLPIFTGKDLKAFKFLNASHFIDFNPEILQQTAKPDMYKSPKICYKFISKRLVTVYDDSGKLVLNSINFFQLLDKEINPRALSAFLNSDIVSFIFRVKFNSTKVLKHHLESLPIPKSFHLYSDELSNIYERGANGEDVQVELNFLVEQLYNLII